MTMKIKDILPGASFYQLQNPLNLENLENQLAQFRFSGISDRTIESTGFCPLGDLPDTPLTYIQDGFQVGNFISAKRDVKTADVNARLDKQVEAIEQVEGVKLGKKRQQDLKESIIMELLPFAPIKYQHTHFVISNSQKLLIVYSQSSTKAETVLAYLRKALGSLPVRPPHYGAVPGIVLSRLLCGTTQPGKGEQIFMPSFGDLKAKGEDDQALQFKAIEMRSEVVRKAFENGAMYPSSIDLELHSCPLKSEPDITFKYHVPKHNSGLVVSGFAFPDINFENVDNLDLEEGLHEYKTLIFLATKIMIQLFKETGVSFGGFTTWADLKDL